LSSLSYHYRRFRLKHRSRVEREDREETDKKRIKKEVRTVTFLRRRIRGSFSLLLF